MYIVCMYVCLYILHVCMYIFKTKQNKIAWIKSSFFNINSKMRSYNICYNLISKRDEREENNKNKQTNCQTNNPI